MRKIRLLPILILVLAFSATAQAQCGEERWPVKTLQDQDAGAVAGRSPLLISVTQLLTNTAPTRAQLDAATSTRFPVENFTYTVDALILGFKKESDSDLHIVITDAGKPGKTMIAEIPAGQCTNAQHKQLFDDLQKQFTQQVGMPTKAYKKLKTPIRATFTGVGFIDFIHGQTGVAANGIELHPVIAFTVHK